MKSSSSGGKRMAKPAAAGARAKKAVAPAAAAVGRFSLEPVYAAARRLVPAARQAELQEFLGEFYRDERIFEYAQKVGIDLVKLEVEA